MKIKNNWKKQKSDDGSKEFYNQNTSARYSHKNVYTNKVVYTDHNGGDKVYIPKKK